MIQITYSYFIMEVLRRGRLSLLPVLIEEIIPMFAPEMAIVSSWKLKGKENNQHTQINTYMISHEGN